MTAPSYPIDELRALADAACEGMLTDADAARLEQLLRGCPDAQQFYLAHVRLDGCLRWEFGNQAQEQTCSLGADPCADSPSIIAIDEHFVGEEIEPSHLLAPDSQVSIYSPLSPPPSPFSASFVGSPVFSYMVATVILGVMLLSAWAYKVSRHDRDSVVDNCPGQTAPGVFDKTPELVFVGRVTGVKDCRWSEIDTQTYLGASVPLKRRYALASGLMEITYRSGAKVILEGPCVYEVESSAGGYLLLGKLTARIEKSGRGGEREKGRLADSTDQSPNLPLTPSPTLLFSVRTPTAVVTDLGTEFGVEAGKDQGDVVHVFQGRVSVRSSSEKSTGSRELTLSAGQSALIDGQGAALQPSKPDGEVKQFAARFVRRMPPPTKLGALDLLDIVCGGDGTGRARGSGIDPATGEKSSTFVSGNYRDGRYRSTSSWNRLIDGVFIPDTAAGPVRLDSAGHAFDGFGPISDTNHGHIWARDTDVQPEEYEANRLYWLYSIPDAWRFSPERRGLLGMLSNSGMTFDLTAICKAHPSIVRPLRFCATVALPRPEGLADIWVFVDGKKKFQQAQLRELDDAVRIDVELRENERFLTLVVTDGNDAIRDAYDWVVFGDPALHVAVRQPEPSNPKIKNEKEDNR